MSFKDLNDKIRARALVPFLEAADTIQGILVNIALRKDSPIRFIDKSAMLRLEETHLFGGHWSRKSLDRMFRIVHFVAIFIAGLCSEGQNIYWISDEDSMFSNREQSEDVARLLSALTSAYIPFRLGELGIATTRLDEGDRLDEDYAAIPDLAAGALSEFLTALSVKCGGRIVGGLAYLNFRRFSDGFCS